MILSDVLLIEKAKLLANRLEIPENTLKFSSGWLKGFKKHNGIHQEKFQGKAASTDQSIIAKALPLLYSKCAEYLLEQIYNMNETGLFYQYVFFFIYILFNIIFILISIFFID